MTFAGDRGRRDLHRAAQNPVWDGQLGGGSCRLERTGARGGKSEDEDESEKGDDGAAKHPLSSACGSPGHPPPFMIVRPGSSPEKADLPALSVTTARRSYAPSGTFVVSNGTVYGLDFAVPMICHDVPNSGTYS